MVAKISAGIFLAITAATMSLSTAADASHSGAPNSGVFGNWGGVKPKLEADGISLKANYSVEGAYNPLGGDREAVEQAGQLTFGATGDLDRLLDIPNAKLQLTITKREGGSLDREAGTHALQQVQEIYGRGNIWRLSEFSYDQTFFLNAIDLKLGRINPGSDFAAFSCDFQNLTFCGADPGNISGNYWMNSPISQWGVRLKWNIDNTLYIETAAYQVNPRNERMGFALTPHGSTGALIPLEVAFVPSGSMPGSYKIGAWYSTADADDLYFDTNHDAQGVTGLPALRRDGSFGAYINFQQQITGSASDEGSQGLTVFLNAVAGDARTTRLDRQVALGGFYTGVFRNRPEDAVALAFGVNHVSGRLAEGEYLNNISGFPLQEIQHSEYVTELDYRLHATDGVDLTPNIQLIHSPGGVTDNANILVVGLKASITL